MIAALRAEFRKLLTVRSTYIIAATALALVVLVSFIEGYKNGPDVVAGPGGNLFLANSIIQHANVLSIFGAIVALLLATHEYRYSTIMYSLTIVNRRSKVLVSKMIAVSVYVLALVIVGVILGFVGMIVSLHFTGHMLPHQDLSAVDYFVKTLFFSEGWAFAALLFAMLLRNQVAALAVLLIVPNTVEGLLGLLLRDHTVYLPFSALSQVITPSVMTASGRGLAERGSLSPSTGALVFLAYLVGGWIITWVLFLKRDAN